MTRSTLGVASLCLLAMSLVVSLAGCGDDERAAGVPASPASTVSSGPPAEASAACAALLDDQLFEVFGWPAGAGAAEGSDVRCQLSVAPNTVTVGERKDLSAGYDDEARRAHERACAALQAREGPVVDGETDWIGDDVSACLLELGSGAETGVATMFVLTDDLALVEVQVAAGSPTPLARLRAGLDLLVPRIEKTW